jgi:hypothetical protein
LTQRKHVFLSFSQNFPQKREKFTTKGKTNARGLREEFFFWGGGEPSPLGKFLKKSRLQIQ